MVDGIGIGGGGLSSLRSLQESLLNQNRLLGQLASGSRIQRGADDPSGLVISERLRSQIEAGIQAIRNTERASALVRTAEGGLSEISGLLRRGRELAVASANTGALSDAEVAANQAELDSILQQVDRLAGSVDFAGEPLLNGRKGFTLENVDAAFRRVEVQRADLPDGAPRTFDVEITTAAAQAEAGGTIAASQSAAATFEVSGALGSEVISVAAGASRADIAAAINAVSDATGVAADATTGAIASSAYGSDAFVEINELEGNLEGVAEGRTSGVDVAGNVDGTAVEGRGNRLFVSNGALQADLLLDAGTSTGNFQFTIAGGGASFQLGDTTRPNERLRLGIDAVDTTRLGLERDPTGLRGLFTGGANALATNPDEAAAILESAIADVSRLRGRLGGVDRHVFESNIDRLGIAVEELAAAESRIRDADFAATISELVRERIRTEAGLAAVGLQNRQSAEILNLLA